MGRIFNEGDLFSFKVLATLCGMAIVVPVAISVVPTRAQHHPTLLPIVKVAQIGKSGHLEFKSSACWNLRTDKHGEAAGEVMIKMVVAFMSFVGGVLLLGVDDGGNLIGFDPGYATLERSDTDHFELWLRGV